MSTPQEDSTPESESRVETIPGAWASFSLGQSAEIDPDEILGRLTAAAAMAGFESQRADATMASKRQIEILRNVAVELCEKDPRCASWTFLLEYPIPRRGKRIDAVLIANHVVVVLEFKIDKTGFERADLWQTQDYVLDLLDFHEASRGVPVEGLLVATKTGDLASDNALDPGTGIHLSNVDTLADRLYAIATARPRIESPSIDPITWAGSEYRPTPTIVQAAQMVFAEHDVKALSHAYADNLSTTTEAIAATIERAKAEGRRVLCFVTGVPGAGKTLAGLTAMQDARAIALGEGVASFMSGNVPLVRILREALVRDRRKSGESSEVAKRKADLLIQNVHHFLKEYGVDRPAAIPPEHVIAFDEAQRAWHAGKLAKRHQSLTVSEPALVLRIMSRPADWSVVVALVGGGQEIHDGEAGFEEWGRALAEDGNPWTVLVSPEVLQGGESVAGHRLFTGEVPVNVSLREDRAMHLGVSVRAPRAQRLSEWVNAVLRADAQSARKALDTVRGFRIVLTRDLARARAWLRDSAGSAFRPGLLASSGAYRLRAEGLELDADFHRGYPIERWFLDGPEDFRSSHSLEVALSEFECQGLELDFVGLCWGDDFTIAGKQDSWRVRRLLGRHWRVASDRKRQYIVNKYRVLLTRAREGLVIWVPKGDHSDPTRAPEPLEATANFLVEAGAVPLDG